MGCDRMKELLCVGKYSEWVDYPPLKIPFRDLFRFWWNRCVEQELVVYEILEDIQLFHRGDETTAEGRATEGAELRL
jgi:hypothetical protein